MKHISRQWSDPGPTAYQSSRWAALAGSSLSVHLSLWPEAGATSPAAASAAER